MASRIFGTSPPGSITTAFLEGSSQMMVQFCSNSVTGTMIAPAFAPAWACVSFCSVMAPQCRFLSCRQAKDLSRGSGTAADIVTRPSQFACCFEPGRSFRVLPREKQFLDGFPHGSERQQLVARRHLLSGLPALLSGFKR